MHDNRYPLEVLLPEHQRMRDPVTGVRLLFITTATSRDLNLYFHERSFLADESMLLFTSDRERGGLMGYLFATGELVRITTPKGGVGAATTVRFRNSVFVLRGLQLLELVLEIHPTNNPRKWPTQVIVTERIVCTLSDTCLPTQHSTETPIAVFLA